MKPKNFPARKLRRQLRARNENIDSPAAQRELANAFGIKTKKRRAN